MAQVLAKEYDCLTCHKPIKIAKLDNGPAGQKKKWERLTSWCNTTLCIAKKQRQQQISTTAASNMSREIAAIKAHLLGLVSRLDTIEQELQK